MKQYETGEKDAHTFLNAIVQQGMRSREETAPISSGEDGVEGRLHLLFKKVTVSELHRAGYIVYVEPWGSPLTRLWWTSYRPDVLGVVVNLLEVKIVLVECETAPTRSRILAKTTAIQRTLVFQKRLDEQYSISSVLAIPPKTLDRVNYSAIRGFWEIWILNRRGRIVSKIPTKHYTGPIR